MEDKPALHRGFARGAGGWLSEGGPEGGGGGPSKEAGARLWQNAEEAVGETGKSTALQAGDPALAEIVRRLVEAYRPERVYLFGSVARGEAGPDSDYDLLLVVPDDSPPERRRSRLAYEVLWGTGVAADVLVWTTSQFDSRKHLPASLPATVLREGKLLHAA